VKTFKNPSQKSTFEIKNVHSGYIQLIDYIGLLHSAEDLDVYIEILSGPGDFVVKNSTTINVFSEHGISSEQIQKLTSKIVVGSKRTPVQDPEYAVHQLVEIALRALSPGVNDPYTALTCVDKLSAVLCDLCKRELPSGFLQDKNDNCRVSYKTISFSGLGEAAFDQIRQFATQSTAITIRLLEALGKIAMQVSTQEQTDFVKSQTQMIAEKLDDTVITQADKSDVKKRIDAIWIQMKTTNNS
jgi:uncharacterized membrane protein